MEPRLGTTAHAQTGARGRGNPDAGPILTLGRAGRARSAVRGSISNKFPDASATTAWLRSPSADRGPKVKSLSPGESPFSLSHLSLASPHPASSPQRGHFFGWSAGSRLLSGVRIKAECRLALRGTEACFYGLPGCWVSFSGHQAVCRSSEFSWSHITCYLLTLPGGGWKGLGCGPKSQRGWLLARLRDPVQTGCQGASEVVTCVGCSR